MRNQSVIICCRFLRTFIHTLMGNSKIVIALVVGIIVIKLVVVHLYLKTKTKQPEENNEENDKSN